MRGLIHFGGAVAALVLAAVLSMAAARSANAVPVSPTPSQIRTLADQTAAFSGNAQLSTVDSIINIVNGIEIHATFRIGAGISDPFDPNYGQNFARISLQSLPFPHLDWSAFDGMKLTITHST